MRYTKRQKAEYLFREMDGIRDSILAQSLAYRPSRRARILPMLALAACLVFAFTVGVGRLLSLFDKAHAPSGDLNDAPAQTLSLDAMLTEQRYHANYTTCASEALIDYFSGDACVVWQYGDSDLLYVSRALSSRELNDLVSEIDRGTAVGTSSPKPNCRVWILLGNGEVLTPYLQNTNGNRSAAELTDYEAELIPTEEFVSSLSEILNDH